MSRPSLRLITPPFFLLVSLSFVGNAENYDDAALFSDYLIQCGGCHTPHGTGVPGRVPAFSELSDRFAADPSARSYLPRVPGAAGSSLSDAALAEMLNWILERYTNAKRGEDFAPYTEAEVAQLRRNPLTDVYAERARFAAALQENTP